MERRVLYLFGPTAYISVWFGYLQYTVSITIHVKSEPNLADLFLPSVVDSELRDYDGTKVLCVCVWLYFVSVLWIWSKWNVCTLDRDVVNTFCRIPYSWCLLTKFTSEILSHQIYGKQKRIPFQQLQKKKPLDGREET